MIQFDLQHSLLKMSFKARKHAYFQYRQSKGFKIERDSFLALQEKNKILSKAG